MTGNSFRWTAASTHVKESDNWNFLLLEANLCNIGFVGIIITTLLAREISSEIHFYSERLSLAFLMNTPPNAVLVTWSRINLHTTELLLWILGPVIQILCTLFLAQGVSLWVLNAEKKFGCIPRQFQDVYVVMNSWGFMTFGSSFSLSNNTF